MIKGLMTEKDSDKNQIFGTRTVLPRELEDYAKYLISQDDGLIELDEILDKSPLRNKEGHKFARQGLDMRNQAIKILSWINYYGDEIKNFNPVWDEIKSFSKYYLGTVIEDFGELRGKLRKNIDCFADMWNLPKEPYNIPIGVFTTIDPNSILVVPYSLELTGTSLVEDLSIMVESCYKTLGGKSWEYFDDFGVFIYRLPVPTGVNNLDYALQMFGKLHKTHRELGLGKIGIDLDIRVENLGPYYHSPSYPIHLEWVKDKSSKKRTKVKPVKVNTPPSKKESSITETTGKKPYIDDNFKAEAFACKNEQGIQEIEMQKCYDPALRSPWGRMVISAVALGSDVSGSIGDTIAANFGAIVKPHIINHALEYLVKENALIVHGQGDQRKYKLPSSK
jgi:hypothetical protein